MSERVQPYRPFSLWLLSRLSPCPAASRSCRDMLPTCRQRRAQGSTARKKEREGKRAAPPHCHAACGPAAEGEISFIAAGYRIAQQIPPAAGQGAPALPGKLCTCLLAGTGCDTAAFAQREDEKHSPCVPSPTGVSRKSTSYLPASFVIHFQKQIELSVRG